MDYSGEPGEYTGEVDGDNMPYGKGSMKYDHGLVQEECGVRASSWRGPMWLVSKPLKIKWQRRSGAVVVVVVVEVVMPGVPRDRSNTGPTASLFCGNRLFVYLNGCRKARVVRLVLSLFCGARKVVRLVL